MYLDCHDNIVDFIDDIIMSYLYTASYFKRYGTVPFGERSHGIKGIEEAYMEKYRVKEKRTLILLLAYVCGIKKYRGHLPCPCESGRKFRNCHGDVILKDIQSNRHDVYRTDAYLLINHYLKESEKERLN